jgi:hypothetical protein
MNSEIAASIITLLYLGLFVNMVTFIFVSILLFRSNASQHSPKGE